MPVTDHGCRIQKDKCTAQAKETKTTEDDKDKYGPHAKAIKRCRNKYQPPPHIEGHRAIALARTSKWRRLLIFLQSLKGGRFPERRVRNAVALSSMVILASRQASALRDHTYDSDSFLIAIDNCASRCITNDMTDFISPPTQVSVTVKGIRGSVLATCKGTVRWSIKDDQWCQHMSHFYKGYWVTEADYTLHTNMADVSHLLRLPLAVEDLP
jgi:hypothetical protein